MTTYRYKQIISSGAMLEYDMDQLGAEGWNLVHVHRLDRLVKGSLPSEQGISKEPTATWIYHFQREIEPEPEAPITYIPHYLLALKSRITDMLRHWGKEPKLDHSILEEFMSLIHQEVFDHKKEALRRQMKEILDGCHITRRSIEQGFFDSQRDRNLAHTAIVNLTHQIEARLEAIKQS